MWILALTITMTLPPQGYFPQESDTLPVIVTTGVGELRLSPERALIRIGVESYDSTATLAAATTGAKLRSVIDTLATLGFEPESVPTVEYSIGPERRCIVGGDCVIGRYRAEATLEVIVHDLQRVAAIIDAALIAGANDIPYIRFDAGDRPAVREQALAAAVAAARRDAEVLAEAAGGKLGRLLKLTSGDLSPYAMLELAGELEFSAPVTPRGIVRKVSVTAKWEFLGPEQ